VDLLNEIKAAQIRKLPEPFVEMNSIADEEGPPIETTRTLPGDLKVVHRYLESDSDDELLGKGKDFNAS
jgi:hypothetical protein